MSDAAIPTDPPAVVVGCDGSDGCGSAMRYAVAEAARRHARLIVVTAFERPIDPDVDSFDITEDDLEQQARRRAELCLARATEHEGPVAAGSTVVAVNGPAVDALTGASVDAAVVVVGARHGGLIHRALSGSTTRAVLAHARIPVVVVPHDYTAPTSRASTTEPPHHADTGGPDHA